MSFRYTLLWGLSNDGDAREALQDESLEIYDFFRHVREDLAGEQRERAMEIIEALKDETVPAKMQSVKYDALSHLFMYAIYDAEEGAIPREIYEQLVEHNGLTQDVVPENE